MPPINRLRPALIPLAALALATTPAHAQRGWGEGRGEGGPGWESGWSHTSPRDAATASREGRVEVERFVADGAAPALAHGPIAVTAAPGGTPDAREEAIYEAAIIDQLAKAGYDTLTPAPQSGQISEITITRDVVRPEEARKNPVSGSMTLGASNRGSMMGMAIAVDLTKPKKALLSTRLELRIRDRVTGKPLWEGRASIITRDEDPHWDQQAIAIRLAASLFEHFPAPTPIAAG